MSEAHVYENEDGKMRWVYEMPMGKSLFLLYEVWKVLGIAAGIVCIFLAILNTIEGNGLEALVSSIEMCIVVFLILLILSFPAYYIVTKANNGKYTVLFEMDEQGIDHIQIKTDMAKALDILTTFVGIKAGNPTTTAAGLLSASGNSLHSDFKKVKKVTAYKDKNLIKLNSGLIQNQVYADDAHFDYVYNYILKHCPNVK